MQLLQRPSLYFALAFTGLVLQTQSAPIETGLAAEKLSALSRELQPFIDDHTVSVSVTLVARHGQVASLEAIGSADLEQRKPMHPDTLFWFFFMNTATT